MPRNRKILAKRANFPSRQWWQRNHRSIVAFLAAISIAACHGNNTPQPQPTATKTNANINILTAFNANEAQIYKKSLASFEKNTGISVNIIPSNGEFANIVSVYAQGLNVPDIALFPQPSLLQQLARSQKILPLSPEIQDLVRQNFAESLNKTVTYEGNIYGVWIQVAVKSLVWYRRDIFDRMGYRTPQTWQEMEELNRRAISDGYSPWCIGIKAAGSNGWAASDWIEEIVMRLYGSNNYDRWISHDIQFNSPEIRGAFDFFGKFVGTPKMVYGGKEKILSTFVEDAAQPMFEEPPRCLMHRQAEWIRTQFPADTTYGVGGKIDIFRLPPFGGKDNNKEQKPALVGGDVAAIFNDRPEVLALVKYLTTSTYGEIRAATGGYLSPHKDVGINKYPTAISRTIAKIWQDSTEIRIDASDLMPPNVGTGKFWTGTIDFIKGKNTTEVLREIDAAWANSQQ